MASGGSDFTASFLQNIELSEYESRFLIHGFESFIDILLIDDKDLAILGASEEHKDKILKAVDDLCVDMLLKIHNLECHIKSFHQQNIKTIKDLKEAKIDDEWFEKLEINQTGHRKRVSLCVQLLQTATKDKGAETDVQPQEQRTAPSLLPQTGFPPWHPDAVAIGYWHRPDTLPDLSHDFLCVKGYLNAGQEDSNASDCLEFLLDSASDVVTAREEILQKLGLKFLKNVKSHGVHTVEDKPLYEGYIRLGKSEWIKVEVQPSEYESVGSTVMKEFFHFINGNFHQWIPYSASHQ